MQHHTDAVSSHRTDWPMFITTALVILMLSVPMVAFKDQAAGVITAAYDAITRSVMLTFGSIGAAMFFIVLGNYALNLELTGALSVTGFIKTAGEAQAITAVISSLPWGTLVLATFTVVALLLLVTTYDSASYTLASFSTMRLEAGLDPARWNRVFWACALGVLPVTLMFIDGGLKVILSATIVCSLPLLVVGVLMVLSLLKMPREDIAQPPAITKPVR